MMLSFPLVLEERLEVRFWHTASHKATFLRIALVVITPRNYVFDLRSGGQLKSHYAMIGMACVMHADFKNLFRI